MSTTKWFLVVDGGSSLRFICGHGTPFPTGTADQVKFLSSRGCYLHCVGSGAGIASLLSVQKNLAKTIARDKPVSTLNVLANIMNTGII